MIHYPTSSDIYIEVNGKKLAVAQSYHAQTTRESRYVEAFGSLEPVGTAAGKVRHILKLSRVCLSGSAIEDGIDFYGLEDFNVVIVKPGIKTIYSGCEWASIQEDAEVGTSVLESVSIIASKRMDLS